MNRGDVPTPYIQLKNAVKLAVRRSPFAPSLRRLRDRGPIYNAIDIGKSRGWDSSAKWVLEGGGRSVLWDAELYNYLINNINKNVEKEFLFTAIRKHLLLNGSGQLDEPDVQRFAFALSRQCSNNDYVWFVSREEAGVVKRLRSSSLSWQEAVLLSMYCHLGELLVEDQWLNDLPQSIAGHIESYAAEVKEELVVRGSIETFREITRSTSKMVGQFYEDAPYPRWVQFWMPARPRKRLLGDFFEKQELAFLERPFKVLVPGCGTGGKAIQYALDYGENAQVLAVDLSRASLAYGKRMAPKYGAENIRFLQMDLLDLPKLAEWFDIVECTGVLHHMRDPIEGAQAIVSRVKPGGVVHISLYSELARREIVRFHQQLPRRMSNVTNDDVRQERRKLMLDHGNNLIDSIPVLAVDFFSLSSCKDLLFHPLEHRFSIPQIPELLQKLGLEFRGFQTPYLIRSQYWTPYPRRKHRRSFRHWQRFEQRNPDAFRALYQIWARKEEVSASEP